MDSTPTLDPCLQSGSVDLRLNSQTTANWTRMGIHVCNTASISHLTPHGFISFFLNIPDGFIDSAGRYARILRIRRPASRGTVTSRQSHTPWMADHGVVS